MISKVKKLESFQSKLDNEHSELERIVYTESILLLNNDVNPDKVQNWVNNILYTYANKPQPISEKEKKRNEEIFAKKLAKKKEKELLFESLNNKMSNLLDEYGVLIIGFFDWKEMSESEYDLLEKLVKNKGYHLTDIGDGAIEPFITKKEVGVEFFKLFNEIEWELNEFNKDGVLNKFKTYDLSVFRNKIGELI